MRANIDTVLFDLDGTLIDTAPDMARALNALLVAEAREPLPFEAVRPHVSHGSTGLLRLAFGEGLAPAELERLRDDFLRRYRADLATESRTFPGIDALLQRLEDNGVRWGVVTNKPGWLTDPLLRALALDERAACAVSGDTLARHKPDPAPLLHACTLVGTAPERAVYVGDAARDVTAGQAAGMETIIALFGYIDSEERPDTWGATVLVDHPDGIWRHIARGRRAEAS